MQSFEKQVEVCCHSVDIRFWDIEQQIDDELKTALTEEGEMRARECINNDMYSGELNCLYNDEEIRGWFKIIRE